MPATQEQGEAILDLLQQCHVAQQAWEQQQAFRRIGVSTFEVSSRKAVEAQVRDTHRQAVRTLVDFYVECSNLGVEAAVVRSVLCRNLSADLRQSLGDKEPKLWEGD